MWHDPDDRLKKAIQRYDEGDVTTARIMLRALDRQGVISPRIDLYLGHCHMEKDRPRAALRRYRRALALTMGKGRGLDVEAWIGIALCHGRLGQLDRAVEALGSAGELEPDREEVHCHLVHCHALLGSLAEAERHARLAVVQDPTCPHVYRHLAIAYLLAGRPGSALAAWQEVSGLAPQHPELDVGLARAFAALGRRGEARRHYRRAIDGAFAGDAHAGLGELAIAEHRFEDAVAHFQNALACDPDHVEARLRLTDVLADVGRLTEAWAILGPLAEHWSPGDGASSGPIEGPDPEVVAVAARTLVLLGRRKEGIRVLRRAWRLRPRSVELPCLIGELLLDLGRPRAALGPLERAQALEFDATDHDATDHDATDADPGLPTRLLARALGRAGHRRRAVKVLSRAAYRYPGVVELWVDVAAALLACGRPLAAERVLMRGLSHRPEAPALWAAAAELALEGGPSDLARQRLRGALRRDPRCPQALALLARWHAERADWTRARHAARAAGRVLPSDHEVVRIQGQGLLESGHHPEAVLVLRRYVLASPSDPQGYRLLARALAASGNGSAARIQERLAAAVGV